MSVRVRSPHARILGLGDYRPSRVVTNDELAETIDTSDTWIRSRTGIGSRHVAAPDDTVVSMAVEAGRKALAASRLSADSIDVVILATCSIPRAIPGGASMVAELLGCASPAAFDLNSACSGFCHGLEVAASLVCRGSARHVLVVGSERFTADWIDWEDRGVCVLFGDGAGAATVGPSSEPDIGPVVWGSDGSGARFIAVPDGDWAIRMDGRNVYRWAMTHVAPLARHVCDEAGVRPADLAAIVPHQANLRIVEAVARTVASHGAVVATDVVDTGNTSAASVPLALSRLVREQQVSSGDLVLLLAFGAGLSWAGQVVRMP
ncbi:MULTISPECIES: beta-ketoacyl-ACP synthase III [unclassified Frankia]|uniref:beta-ketoacyl-ACP synthase III n=1 Tax=unclassified Frankia TaxID=2632575 RepID=UPI001EF72961|nr:MULTISPECIES: beta-ketoacyl-ACP synthase III [unclassified Frankia]